MDISKLKRISTYAVIIGKSQAWVGKLIKAGKVKTVVIDGTIFIKTI